MECKKNNISKYYYGTLGKQRGQIKSIQIVWCLKRKWKCLFTLYKQMKVKKYKLTKIHTHTVRSHLLGRCLIDLVNDKLQEVGLLWESLQPLLLLEISISFYFCKLSPLPRKGKNLLPNFTISMWKSMIQSWCYNGQQ